MTCPRFLDGKIQRLHDLGVDLKDVDVVDDGGDDVDVDFDPGIESSLFAVVVVAAAAVDDAGHAAVVVVAAHSHSLDYYY